MKIPLWVHVILYVSLAVTLLATIMQIKYEQEWIEGDAFVTFVYQYNLPFWRIRCFSQAPSIVGEFFISSKFNISLGWWHLIIKGGVVINAWEVT